MFLKAEDGVIVGEAPLDFAILVAVLFVVSDPDREAPCEAEDEGEVIAD